MGHPLGFCFCLLCYSLDFGGLFSRVAALTGLEYIMKVSRVVITFSMRIVLIMR